MPLCRCKAVQSHGLFIVLRNTLYMLKGVTQLELGISKPLGRGKTAQLHSLRQVNCNTSTAVKLARQIALSACIPLCRCKAVQSASPFATSLAKP